LELKKQKKWDIFCKIVDNFGDIGVCWRLAKQLKNEHDLEIRFFVDKISIAKQILTGLDIKAAVQIYEGITIINWQDNTIFDDDVDVVLETFACGLPLVYLTNLHAATIWVNVEYLSAEAWVPDFHALDGRHHESNRKRYVYFPGFNEMTGGLLRERDLIARRDTFQQSRALQYAFWQSLGINSMSDGLNVSLFSYANAPIDYLFSALINGEQRVNLFMPFNDCLPKRLLGKEKVAIGDCLIKGNLTLHILPFLTQENYDQLLWACNINFVRGEDSWVRAIWAGKPFVWQPYWQTEQTHMVKLNAFLKTYYASCPMSETITALHQSWADGEFSSNLWALYVEHLAEINAFSQKQSRALMQQDTLTNKLVAFCANLPK
jgi:uncharacterized repeat protein (TIGR03837 family)